MLGVGVLVLTGAVGLAACGPQSVAPSVAGEPTLRVPPTLPPRLTPAPLVSVTVAAAAFRRVSPAGLAAELAAGTLLLDVRLPEDFAVRHIPGAELFPLATAADHLAALPRDRPLVAYCA